MISPENGNITVETRRPQGIGSRYSYIASVLLNGKLLPPKLSGFGIEVALQELDVIEAVLHFARLATTCARCLWFY